MAIISTYVAYRLGKRALGVYETKKKELDQWWKHKERILSRGCHQGGDCAFFWAIEDLRSYSVPDGVYSKNLLKKELEWHQEHNIPVTPPHNNWRCSYVVISAMCYEMGEEYAVQTASPALEMLYDVIDYSGYETKDGCWLIADELARNPGAHSTVISIAYAAGTNEKYGFQEAFTAACEEEGSLEPGEELSDRDFSDNVAGLGLF